MPHAQGKQRRSPLFVVGDMPAMPFLSKLTIGHKLALIGAMFALPLGFLLYSVVAEKNIAIEFARKEISGNHFLAALTTAQMAMQRSTAARLDEIDGIGASDAAAVGAGHDTAQVIEGIASATREFADVAIDPALAAATVDAAHAYLTAAGTLGPDQLAARHAKLAAKIRDLITRVGDESNLILVPTSILSTRCTAWS